MSSPTAAIGKIYVDLHIAKEALETEHSSWECHLDFSTCIPPVSEETALRQLNSHKRKIREITDRINGYEAQIKSLEQS